MKNLVPFLILLLVLHSCKDQENKLPLESVNSVNTMKQPEKTPVDVSKYPQALQDVFEAHGGLQRWANMRTLTFKLGEEVHTSNLNNRDILIESPNYNIGRDAGQVWIAQDSIAFPPARARFYHNLMFYFYAMPFLFADDGIVYNDAPPLEMDGVIHPAIKISYQANVGDSPDDEYILYYHPETKKMTWLAYTVTYGKNEKSEIFKYIKYDQWQEVNGLLLPQYIDWYNTQDNLPTISRRTPRIFENVDIDGASMDHAFYTIPDNGVFVD